MRASYIKSELNGFLHGQKVISIQNLIYMSPLKTTKANDTYKKFKNMYILGNSKNNYIQLCIQDLQT